MKNTYKVGILSSVAVCTSFVTAITACAKNVVKDSILDNLRDAILDSQEFMIQNDIAWLNDDSNIFTLSLAKYNYSSGEYDTVVDLFFAVSSFNFTSYSATYYIKQGAGTYRRADGFTKLIAEPGLAITVENYRIRVPYSLTGQSQDYWYFVDNTDNITYDYIITYCDIPEVTDEGQGVITTFQPDQKYLDLDIYKYNNYFDKTDNNLTNIYNTTLPEQPVDTTPAFTLPPSWLSQTTATVPLPLVPSTTVTLPDPAQPPALPAGLADGLRFWSALSTDVINRFQLLPALLFVLALAVAGYIIF